MICQTMGRLLQQERLKAEHKKSAANDEQLLTAAHDFNLAAAAVNDHLKGCSVCSWRDVEMSGIVA